MGLAGTAGQVETPTKAGSATRASQDLAGTHGHPMAASTLVTGKITRRMALGSIFTQIRVSTSGITTMTDLMVWGCTNGLTATSTRASGRMESGAESACLSGRKTKQAMSGSLRPIL